MRISIWGSLGLVLGLVIFVTGMSSPPSEVTVVRDADPFKIPKAPSGLIPPRINPTIKPPGVILKKGPYETRWDSSKISASKKSDADHIAHRIILNKDRYIKVSKEFDNLPWYVIAVIHNMECSLRFDKHLHNGDTISRKTVNVPANRPAGSPPFTWEYSAKDALIYDKFDRVTDWSLEHLLYTIERYNGVGYLKYHSDVPTPYLWSGTSAYSAGKYVSDGKWCQTCVSSQIGVVPLLKILSEYSEISIPRQ